MHRGSPRSPFAWTHAVLGAALVAFLIVHLIQCWPLAGDPREYVIDAAERIDAGRARVVAIAVLALVAGHALLALFGLRRIDARVASARGLALVQVVAGVLSATFVVHHVLQVRVLERGPQLGAWDAYGELLSALGHPTQLIAYVVGITAVCFHVALGAARFTSDTPAGGRGQRVLFGALALLLWALWLQPLARLATGAALF